MTIDGAALPRDPAPAERRRPLTARQARDLTALLLIVAGVGSLIYLAFSIDVHLGAAAVAVAAIIVGVLLGLDR